MLASVSTPFAVILYPIGPIGPTGPATPCTPWIDPMNLWKTSKTLGITGLACGKLSHPRVHCAPVSSADTRARHSPWHTWSPAGLDTLTTPGLDTAGPRTFYFRPEGGLWGDRGDPTGVLGFGNLCQNTQPLQNRREDASEES